MPFAQETQCFGTIFLAAPNALPLQARKFYFYCCLAVSENRRKLAATTAADHRSRAILQPQRPRDTDRDDDLTLFTILGGGGPQVRPECTVPSHSHALANSIVTSTRKEFPQRVDEILAILFAKPFAIASELICSAESASFLLRLVAKIR